MTHSEKLRHGATLALIMAFGSLFWRFAGFFGTMLQAIRWPFGLDYGEGLTWQQAAVLFTPQSYGPINVFPSIVSNYPPLYHLILRGLTSVSGADILLVGRMISACATLLTAIVAGLIVTAAVPRETGSCGKWIACLAGALTVFCFYPVELWAVLMRVDMLAFLFSVTGFWLGLKALRQPNWIYAAAMAFVAAVYTKQTSLPAPVALFALLLWFRPKVAIRGITTCIVLGLIILGVLQWATDGGFVRHAFLYNINRFEWRRLQPLLESSPYFLLAGLISARRLNGIRRQIAAKTQLDNADISWIGVVFYAITSSIMLVTIAKSGATINYMIEWMLVISMLTGCALVDCWKLISERSGTTKYSRGLVFSAIGVPLVVTAQAWAVKTPNYDSVWSPGRSAQLVTLSDMVRASRRPIISDDMVMLRRSGQNVVWEPAMYTELALKGYWDQATFVQRIHAHQFQMFITEGQRGDATFDDRYNAPVADAMDAAYPVKRQLAGYTLHLR
ncbi:MAG: hypothetical protein JWL66_125 [Sphingomonadales bacterium]|nr:hypothetical protein [Sphingomonadales bacterium]